MNSEVGIFLAGAGIFIFAISELTFDLIEMLTYGLGL
jgi:hypothetical protein